MMTNQLATTGQGQIERVEAQDKLIGLVLDSVNSEHTKRAYERALVDFLEWHSEQGRPAINKALVQRYKTGLEAQGMGTASINQRLSAIRKLAAEASDNGWLSEQVANGIARVRGKRQEGTRSGNWLTRAQAQTLLNAPDCTTLKGLRDRAILAILLGCGLRRTEVAELTWEHIQQRDGRWAVVDLVGKRDKVRTVPMPTWAKKALDAWAIEAGLALGGLALNEGRVFRSVNKWGDLGDSISPQSIRDIVTGYTADLGFGEVAPHDLRRTFAKLARSGGSDLEQIQLSLGHASISTTQRYLGTTQDFGDAPADRLGLRL